MKMYQTPVILWQDVDLADILTGSPTQTPNPKQTIFNNGSGGDNNTLDWWG